MTLSIDNRAEGLIFDLDGTLVNTMPIHFEAWKKMARNYGFEFTREIFHHYAGIPTRTIISLLSEEMNLSIDPDEATEIKENAFLEHLDRVEPIEMVIDLLKENAGKRPVSVGTGSSRHMADKILHAAGLSDYFSVVVSADDVTEHKPAPETFLTCARHMQVPPEKCQVFEDGDQGLEAARKAGMIPTDIRPFL